MKEIIKDKVAVIYGVKTNNNKFHYIGKTIKKLKTNKGNINTSITSQYKNQLLCDVFHSYESINIEPIILVPENKWYPEKLKEVIKKYKENNPLVNAQWMLEGKNGYWEGKKRDTNTLKRLSESKYKQIIQYDNKGNFMKIWDSGKEVGIKIFKDYKIINGGGDTKFYGMIDNNLIKNRYAFNSYWFKLEEIIKHFNGIPKKLNIHNLIKKENEVRKQKRIKNGKFISHTHQKRYTVERYNTNNELITIYKNIKEAAYILKIGYTIIKRLCRNEIKSDKLILKYGEKLLQPTNATYPSYKIIPLKNIKI